MQLASSLLALTLALSAEPSDAAATRLGPEQCRAQELDFFVSYGPASAASVLRVYIDPTTSDQDPLRVWLEVQRIAGERPTELRVEIVVTRGGSVEPETDADSVRLWFMAAASLGRAEAALRILDHLDWPRVAAALRTDEGHATLAESLGLDATELRARTRGASGSCLRRNLDEGARHIAAQTMGNPSSLVGIVAHGGPEQFQYIDATLSELRTQLDRLSTAPSFAEDSLAFVPFGPGLSGRSSRLDRTFPNAGILLGGDALPHRLLIFVEDEEHGRLPDWLAPAMVYREQHPGDLSLQLIAAGPGTRAINLRRRLCAARTLGLEVEFLRHLSQRPALRRLHESDLDEVLQPVADSEACSDDEPLEQPEDQAQGRRGNFGHPRGAWLDGRPVNPSDLANLDYELGSQLHPSIVDWLSTPDAFAIDPSSFEDAGFEF